MYAAAVVAMLANATIGEALGLQNSTTELMKERAIYTRLSISALVLVIEFGDRDRPCDYDNKDRPLGIGQAQIFSAKEREEERSCRTCGGDVGIHTAAAPLAWVTRVLYRSCAALSRCFAAFSVRSSYCWRLVMAMYDFWAA